MLRLTLTHSYYMVCQGFFIMERNNKEDRVRVATLIKALFQTETDLLDQEDSRYVERQLLLLNASDILLGMILKRRNTEFVIINSTKDMQVSIAMGNTITQTTTVELNLNNKKCFTMIT